MPMDVNAPPLMPSSTSRNPRVVSYPSQPVQLHVGTRSQLIEHRVGGLWVSEHRIITTVFLKLVGLASTPCEVADVSVVNEAVAAVQAISDGRVYGPKTLHLPVEHCAALQPPLHRGAVA